MVERVVVLAPTPHDPVGSGDDHIPDQLVDRQIRGRSSNTSTAPRTSPRTPATPVVGWIRPAASCSRVVLPAPFGPRMTHRWPSSPSQVMSFISVLPSRTTLTPANSRTSLMRPDPRPHTFDHS